MRLWRAAALVGLVAWAVAVLRLNDPGHLSIDSLIQIAEGRSGNFVSFNPVFITVVFGKLAAFGGTRLLVACATLMLLVALVGLLPGVERPRFIGLALLAAALVGPILLIYPAIVWKDVWFAHFSLLGFAFIAWRQQLPRFVVEAAVPLLFAMALMSRQNGAIVALCGVATLAWARWADNTRGAGPRSRPSKLLAGTAWRVAILVLLAVALGVAARLGMQQSPAGEVGAGVRVLFIYDAAGIAAHAPAPNLSALSSHGFDIERLVTASRSTYSGVRIDDIELDWSSPVWFEPLSTVGGMWLSLVAAQPSAYLRHRLEAFAWLLGLREQARCIPVFVGISDAELAAKAGVPSKTARYAFELYRYALRFVNTPYFSPGAWAVGSILVLIVMATRRRFDPVIGGLQVAGLAYLGLYFFVSLACDFRYAYFSVLAATVGLVWLAAGGSRRGGRDAVQ
jgi:hypothetical protein